VVARLRVYEIPAGAAIDTAVTYRERDLFLPKLTIGESPGVVVHSGESARLELHGSSYDVFALMVGRSLYMNMARTDTTAPGSH
jgi:hypothetical protein